MNTITASVVGLYALAQKFSMFPGWTLVSSYGDRVTSTLGNPIYLGHYLLLSIWLAALGTVYEPRIMRRRLLLLFIPFAFSIILLTANRSTVIIAAVGILLFGLWSIRKTYLTKIFLVITAGTLITLPFFIGIRHNQSFLMIADRISQESLIDNNRLLLWRIGLRSFLQRPVFGWGNGNFDYAYYANVRVPDEYAKLPLGIPDNTHNIIIEILVGSGLLGLLAITFVSIAIIWHIRTLRNMGGNTNMLASLYLSAFFLSAALQDLTIFDTPSTIILLTFGFAILHHVSLGSQGEKEKNIFVHIPHYAGIATITFIGMLSFFVAIMPAYASYLSKRAWHIFPDDIPRGFSVHRQAIRLGGYISPEIRQVFAGNVIAAYAKVPNDAYLLDSVLPVALAEAEKSFLEHPLSLKWVTQYATLLRIDITEHGNDASRQALERLLHRTLALYPNYPDIRFEQLQYFLAINDLKSFHASVASLTALLPSDVRTHWFSALSFLMNGETAKAVDTLLEAEQKGYDIFTQANVWIILAEKAQGEEILRVRTALKRAIEKNPSNLGLRDALGKADERGAPKNLRQEP